MADPSIELRAEVERLLKLPIAEKELRAKLEPLAARPEFGSLTAVWGPVLYRRDRIFWRPFILHHFSYISAWQVAKWRENTDRLDPWLDAVDRDGDVELFRRLYNWKLESTSKNYREIPPRWRADLLAHFRSAATRAERNQVLARFSSWQQLDEPSALELYDTDAQLTRPFILQHLPSNWSWTGEVRKVWRTLAAKARDDEELYFPLYRKQTSLDEWKRDVVALADSINDSDRLNDELTKRHLEGWNLDFGPGFEELLKRRGRDVFRYVLPRVKDLSKGWGVRGSVKSLVKLAASNEWIDLWATLIRSAGDRDTFVNAVEELVDNQRLDDAEVTRRLLMLAGASHEWNFGPFSFAQVFPLTDEVAVKLYTRYPNLMRGPFKMNVGLRYGSDFPGLTKLAMQNDDESLIDYLASRAAMMIVWRNDPGTIRTLADYYIELRENEHEFARRAAAALTQIPAFAIWNYNQLLANNALARILFERTEPLFLDDPRAVRDLLECPQIFVQFLAFRVLALDDPRAASIGANNTDLLQAALFRPLHRRTRLAAFRAIDRAASTPSAARYLVMRVREAFGITEKRYPREQLIGLLGNLLHRWPELRGEREQPLVYGAQR